MRTDNKGGRVEVWGKGTNATRAALRVNENGNEVAATWDKEAIANDGGLTEGRNRMQEKTKLPEMSRFGKACSVIFVCCSLAIIFDIPIIYSGCNNGCNKKYVQKWTEERKVCAEWRESFPDKQLIEIVRKDVDGQTSDQIGNFYGVSGRCIEKRINEDRGLYDQLKAQYILRYY